MFDDYYIDRTYNVYNNLFSDYGTVDGSENNWTNAGYFHGSQFYTTSLVDFVTLGPVTSGLYYGPSFGYQYEFYRDVGTFQELLPTLSPQMRLRVMRVMVIGY